MCLLCAVQVQIYTYNMTAAYRELRRLLVSCLHDNTGLQSVHHAICYH